MPSARPSATATIMTSSSSEPDAEAPRSLLTSRHRKPGPRSASAVARRRRRCVAPSSAASASACSSTASPGTSSSAAARGRRPRGIVQQARLDDLLRAGVAALAHAGALADAAAQVVELGAPDVAAGGDLDPLDLRRVHRERALHADAEGLLADGEGLAHAVALALDDDALEDLRAAARALDDLEVDADAVAGLEGGDAAQLRALEAVDDGAHGEEKAARAREAVAAAAYGSEAPPDCSARARRLLARASRGSARGGR